MCTALVLPHVNRQMYTLLTCTSFPKTVFAQIGPAKSTPVLAKGCPSLNLNSGITDDGSALYGSALYKAIIELFPNALSAFGEPETRFQFR